MKLAGLDIGTTGCKCTVFDESGRRLDRAYREYPATHTASLHEIDARALLSGVFAAIREMAAKYPDIGGVGVTSFGETFVMTDEAGDPLHTAMLYTDPRGAEECGALADALGEDKIVRITGLVPHEMYTVGKIMWIKAHHPTVFAAAKHIFLMEDFVVYRLTGKAQIDYSLASRTMAFDIERLAWSDPILNAAGVDPALLSKPVPTGTPAGTVKATADTGLSASCVVVSVAHDQLAAAVGAGAFDGSVAVDGAGTVSCFTPVFDALPDRTVLARSRVAAVPYVIPGKYVAYAFSYTGGSLLAWCVDTFGAGLSHADLEKQCADEPTGLLVLPHFAGAATPYMDSGSRGAILGLTTATTLPTLYRACMEGVVYEMRLNFDALADSGMHPTVLHATGGGAKSKCWMQMKADILGLPVISLETEDAGTVGCAMLTGVAVGVYADLADAAAKMVRPVGEYLPRPDKHEKYMAVYERYRGVYRAVRPLM